MHIAIYCTYAYNTVTTYICGHVCIDHCKCKEKYTTNTISVSVQRD